MGGVGGVGAGGGSSGGGGMQPIPYATVDIDGYQARNNAQWARLASLTDRARRPGRLSSAELDELISLYQRVSTQLSYARGYYRDPALTEQLTTLVASANAVVYGSRPRTLRAIGRFFSVTFPAAVWFNRRMIVISAALLLLPALAVGAWLVQSEAALDIAAPEYVREAYLDHEFEDYYTSEPAGAFATKVFVNNVQVAIMAFAAGALLCVVTAFVMASNGMNVGVAGALFVDAGAGGKFFGLILPHGLLELSAVVIAGAAGLRLGWTIIAPGDRTRANALAEEGRRSVAIVLGLILVFAVAGAIEGFITGSGLSTALRVGIGTLVFVTFWTYVMVRGRAALDAGFTGLLSDDDRARRAHGLDTDISKAGRKSV